MIQRLTIVGVGVIGGSLARALRQAGAVDEIVGSGRSRESLAAALALGVIDRAEPACERAVAGADVVVLATPVGVMDEILARIAPALAAGAIVTDVGSVKHAVVSAARRRLAAGFAQFVPGHPIAGSEKSGIAAATADLFRGRRVVLTPVAETAVEAVARVRRMWEVTGAQVTEMAPDRHDAILAATSHLPQLLAYALMDFLARGDANVFDFAGGGLRDSTRIAASDPVMWRDICLANRAHIARTLREFGAGLETLAAAIERGDGPALHALFERANRAREAFLDK